MIAWRMEVRCPDGEWRAVRPTGREEPYEYATEQEAVRMLEICYPDQCREQRLDGVHAPYKEGTRVRVVPVERAP